MRLIKITTDAGYHCEMLQFRPIGVPEQIVPINLNPSSIRCKLWHAWLAAFPILEFPIVNKRANNYWGSTKLKSLFCSLEDKSQHIRRESTHFKPISGGLYKIRNDETSQHLLEQYTLFSRMGTGKGKLIDIGDKIKSFPTTSTS